MLQPAIRQLPSLDSRLRPLLDRVETVLWIFPVVFKASGNRLEVANLLLKGAFGFRVGKRRLLSFKRL